MADTGGQLPIAAYDMLYMKACLGNDGKLLLALFISLLLIS